MTDRQDIYIRLNEDPDKDYCFSVKKDLRIVDLKKIFETIPVILSPNYFNGTVPKGFKVSAHPGFLTAEGALLFDWEADCEQYLANLDQLALVKDVLLPGCLVVPVWDFKPLRYYGILGLLLVWLYLDLPDFISPTPGHQPTILLGKLLAPFSKTIADEVLRPQAFVGRHWDILFFVLHLLKVCILWIVFRVGIINVRSLNPLKRGQGPSVDNVTAEKLADLGWTGVHRMLPDEWRNKHRDHVIAQHENSVVKAYASGKLNIKDGLELEDGEGWSILKTGPKPVGKDLLTEDGKFVVSEQYLLEVGNYASQLLVEARSKVQGEDFSELDQIARQVRQYGFMDGPPTIKATFLKLEEERHPKPKLN